jgi:hypothetical protein
MATWKKIIVSGSSAQLAALKVDNLSSGVVTGAAGNLTTTAVNGTGNIVATTGATNVVMTGSFTGSFAGDGSGLTGVVAAAGFSLTQGEGISSFSYNGASAQTVAISGAAQLSDNAITKWNNTDGKFVNSSITDNGSTITGATSIQLTGASSVITGSFTGSFTGNGSGLTGIATASYANNATSASYANNATSASYALTASYAENASADLAITGSNGSSGSVNLKTQGLTITGTSNEIETSVAGQTVTIGLPNNVTIGSNLIVNNNLTVLGTASFQNTENLEVADRFILLASGSNTSGDGGLVIQQGTQNVGELFAFDSGVTRWGFTSSFNAASSSFTPDAFVAAAIDGGVGSDPTAINARYQAKGNIFVGADESIWIYS